MKWFYLAILVCIMNLTGGCESKIKSSEPSTYQFGGLSLEYANTWAIDEALETQGIYELYIDVPGDGLCAVNLYPTELADELEGFARSFSENASEGASGTEVTFSKSVFKPQAKALGYDVIEDSFSVTVMGVSVPHKRRFYSKDSNGYRFFIIIQTASGSFSNATKELEFLLNSIKVSPTASIIPAKPKAQAAWLV